MTRSGSIAICGPTAAGKSGLADRLAESLSVTHASRVTVISVDSMQVYREVPTLTNQGRGRPAELVGVVSVEEKWNVARHKEAADRVISDLEGDLPFVLDAGTGMYLNAILLDIPMSPRVPPGTRAEAERMADEERREQRGGNGGIESIIDSPSNRRRRVRALELSLVGAPARGSVWSTRRRHEAGLVYLRPPRQVLDKRIWERSWCIAREGTQETEALVKAIRTEGLRPNPSVLAAVGVREMMAFVDGLANETETVEAIASRTRKLARRQMRWFDKLAKSLPVLEVGAPSGARIEGHAPVPPSLVVEHEGDPRIEEYSLNLQGR